MWHVSVVVLSVAVICLNIVFSFEMLLHMGLAKFIFTYVLKFSLKTPLGIRLPRNLSIFYSNEFIL